jgi:hypothetical protein
MSAWQQQKLADLRRALAAHLARRAELAADTAQADAVRRLDGDIAEHCRAIADIERALRTTP